jgi:hypothetical protein
MLPSGGSAIPNTAAPPAQDHVEIAGSLDEVGLTVFYKDIYRGLITSNPPVNAGSCETPSLMPHLIKEWIKECENHHGHDLSILAPRYKHAVEIVLVDVVDKKLVRASSSWRFLTLSYVWGKAALEMTTTANRAARGQQGAFLKLNLPRLISDAMLLVSQLGERYLWVDCLCIEQDNLSQKLSQISQMDVIYSQSLLTLVALSSEDAGSCLPGVRPGTRSFFRAQEYAFDRDIYALYPRLLELSEATVYESRGWTFQERLLSRRCLFLTECDMYYTCHSSLSRETGANSARGEENVFRDKFKNIFSQCSSCSMPDWPRTFSLYASETFALYASLVHEYSKRDLSDDTDVINAFSGISAVLGHILDSGSVSGLIECVLDNCLLWVPGDSKTHSRNLDFPSWSWAGWRGEAFYLQGPLYYLYSNTENHGIPLVEIQSLVDKFNTQSISPLRPIFRLSQHQENSAIASGESKQATKGIDILSFEANTANIMQLNLSSADSVVRGDVLLGSRGIHSRSVRICHLVDTNQQICGYLHSYPSMPFSSTRAQNHRELVALSLSQYPGRTTSIINDRAFYPGKPGSRERDNYSILFDHDSFMGEIFPPGSSWCLLNIMLVEWKGSEAERVTIGQIHKDAWARLQTQRKLIRLI